MWLSEQKTFDLKNSLKCAEMRGRSQTYSHLTVTDLGKKKQKKNFYLYFEFGVCDLV